MTWLCSRWKSSWHAKDCSTTEGKLGGQHKIPRLSNTREYIEEMLALNK